MLKQDATLSQEWPRDAAVHFDTHRILHGNGDYSQKCGQGFKLTDNY